MRARFFLTLGIALVACLGLSQVANAQAACDGMCNPLIDCRVPCHTGSMPLITCGEYQSCNADPDNDGVLWWNDNCPMTYNPNQANCDGDDTGDVCDPANEKWVIVENSFQLCYIDVDGHLLTQTLEAYSRQVYTNICGSGGTCIKHYLLGSGDCPRPLSASYCCDEGFPEEACDMFLNQDRCGLPKCTF